MSTPGKKAGANLAKVGLVIVLPVCVAIWAAWHYAAQALDPQVSRSEAQIVVGVAAFFWLVAMVVAEKRTRLRLDSQTAAGPKAGFVSAVTGSLHVGSMTNYSVTTAWRLTSALLSVSAVLIACGLVVVLAGYAPVAVPDRWPWTALPWAVLPIGLVTAFAMARKIAAVVFGVGLTGRMLGRQTAAWPIGIAGGAAAFLTAGVPVSTAAVIGATGGLAVSSTATGVAAARQAKRKAYVAGKLEAVLAVGHPTIEKHLRWRVSAGTPEQQTITIQAPVPGDVIKHASGLEERLAAHMPTHELQGEATTGRGFALVPVSMDTGQRRARLAESRGLVEGIDETSETTETWTLADSIKPADADRVAELARARGLTLVEWLPYQQMAEVAKLGDRERIARARVAELAGVARPWDVAVESEFDDAVRLTGLTVTRGSTLTGKRAERRDRWHELFVQLSPFAPGTHVDYRDSDGTVTIRRVPDPLATTTSIADFIERYRDPAVPPEQSWASFPIAMGEDGQPVNYSLFHTLGVGQTGAGKGSFIWSILSGLLPSWEAGLVTCYGIDPKNAELRWEVDGQKRDHGMFDLVATDPDAWGELIEHVHGLMKRRQESSGRAFQIRPDNHVVVLVIDELSALGQMDTDAKRARLNEQRLLEIASQGRSDGVYIVAAVQQPQKDAVGRMRGFFGYRLALRTERPWETDAVLGDGATEAGAAAHTIPVASPGNGYATAGIAYARAEATAGFSRIRFPYTSDEQLGEWDGLCRRVRPLETRDIPEIGSGVIGPPPDWNTPEPVEPVPEVTDLGELDLDLDLTDLDAENGAATTESESKSEFDFGKFKL